VPKSFSAYNPMQSLADIRLHTFPDRWHGHLNRSKAFHECVLEESSGCGFPDRFSGTRGAVARVSTIDISRVGIYGLVRGRQNAGWEPFCFTRRFYKVAVAASGCHDIVWKKSGGTNWMGWPRGPEYVGCFECGERLAAEGQAAADRW